MIWFLGACIAGFALYWWPRWRESAIPIALSIAAAGFAAAWLARAFLWELGNEFGADAVVRALLGVILGLGFGHALHNDHLKPAYYVWIGVILVVLTAIAPHIDRWLWHLNGFKSPVLEIQLANSASSIRDVVGPDAARENLLERPSLLWFGDYAKHTADDLEFMRQVRPDFAGTDRAKHLGSLRDVFAGTFRPIAGCMALAIERGFSIESAKQIVRPLVDTGRQIMLRDKAIEDRRIKLRNRASENRASGLLRRDFVARMRQVKRLRKNFMTGFRDMRSKIKNYVVAGEKSCPEAKTSDFPSYEQYGDLPHLYGAMAALAVFSGNEDLALQILRETTFNRRNSKDKTRQAFEDDASASYAFLQYAILWNENAPLSSYLPYLNDVYDKARRRRFQIEIAEKTCTPPDCEALKRLRKRAREDELLAANNRAYSIAQDLAERTIPADGSQAEQDAKVLEMALANGEIEQTVCDDDEKVYTRYAYLDTIGFVILVVEARKPLPDLNRVSIAENYFRKASSEFEDRANREQARREKDGGFYSTTLPDPDCRPKHDERRLRAGAHVIRDHLRSARLFLQ